jgi:3-dehydroquinate synthase
MVDPGGEAEPVVVRLGDRSHPVRIRAGGSRELGADLAARVPGDRAFVTTDRNVLPLHAEAVRDDLERSGFATRLHVIPPGESSKSLSELERMYGELAEWRHESGEPIVAVGGGVVGDLAGFAAATYRRGVPIVHVPTSLLAQVDSSVGGKTGVNLPRGKNLVGAYHQPTAVYTDPTVLATLPEEEYRSGLAEVVKYGITSDAGLVASIETNAEGIANRDPGILAPLIRRCVGIKARIVEADEREEKGERLLLNLGHTVGHALESATDYALRHGEAVSIGLVCACRLALARGRLSAADADRVRRLLTGLGLPVDVPAHLDRSRILEPLRRDKKIAARRIRFVLPESIGRASVAEVSVEEVLASLG